MAWHGRDPSKIGGRLSANAFHSDKKVFFRPAVDAIKFTLNVEELLKATEGGDNDKVLKILNEGGHVAEETVKDNKPDLKVNKMSKKDPTELEACISCSG